LNNGSPRNNHYRKLASGDARRNPAGAGAADSAIEQEADQRRLRILIERPQVERYGLNVQDIQDLIDVRQDQPAMAPSGGNR